MLERPWKYPRKMHEIEVKIMAGDNASIVRYDSGECIISDIGPAKTAVRKQVNKPADISSATDTRRVLCESLYLDDASCSEIIFDNATGIPELVITNTSW